MGYIIAMAGKGGTGKTTLAALLVRLLKEAKRGSILAVDADPNSNLAELLGLKTAATVGNIIDQVAENPDKIPAGMTKDRFIEYKVQTGLQEADGFDVLTMGKPEGPGCYCYVNNVLRNVLAKLIADYDFTVIDNEAGLEHLSRKTTNKADSLVVVSDPGVVGLKAAARISALADSLKIKTGKKLLMVNRAKKAPRKELLDETGLEFIGMIPQDEQVQEISLNGTSLFGLKDDAESLSALRKMIDKILGVGNT